MAKPKLQPAPYDNLKQRRLWLGPESQGMHVCRVLKSEDDLIELSEALGEMVYIPI
jgi:hypothetical protein